MVTLRINPNAGDSCIKISNLPHGGYIGWVRPPNPKCSQFHEIAFEWFPSNEGTDFNWYYYFWRKNESKFWWDELPEGTPAEFEMKQE